MAGCKDCTDRYPGCHDKCVVYREYKKALEEEKRKISEIKNRHEEHQSFRAERVRKMRRRRGQK